MSFLPPALPGGSASNRYWEPNKIPDGGEEWIRLCGTYASGHSARGFRYWRSNNMPVYSGEWPKETPDIKMRPSRNNPAVLEPDGIQEVLLLCGFVMSQGGFRLLEITQKAIRLELAAMAEAGTYTFDDDGTANFVIKIQKNVIINPAVPTYITTGYPGKPANQEMRDAWSVFAPTVNPSARLLGLNPFSTAPSGEADPALGEDIVYASVETVPSL